MELGNGLGHLTYSTLVHPGDNWGEMFPNVKRHTDEITARPAAQRAMALKDQFAFKTEVDEEARKFLFPQNAHLVA